MPPIFGRSLHARLVTTSLLHERHPIFAALCTRNFAMLQTRFLRRESRLTEAAKTCRSAVEHRAPPDEITTCNRAILAYVSPR
jgi:hypothetical protein